MIRWFPPLLSIRRFQLTALIAAILAAGLAPATATAQQSARQISGRAPVVVDSASLDFAGQRLALYGLRAVAPSQTCTIAGQVWACGQEARWAARNRIANHWVVCLERARSAAGEVLAICYLGGVGGPELNAWLVEQGWALAERDTTTDYLVQEEAARAGGRGLWRGR